MAEDYGRHFMIHRDGDESSELFIFGHGSYATKNAKRTIVPNQSSLYFYIWHGSQNAGKGAYAPMEGTSENNTVVSTIFPHGPNAPGQTVVKPGGFGEEGDDYSAGDMLITGSGRPTSIAGPGSLVWDYTLGHHDDFDGAIKSLQNGSLHGKADIVVAKEVRGEVRLSNLFRTIKRRGNAYQKIHYLPCRVTSKTGYQNESGPRWDKFGI